MAKGIGTTKSVGSSSAGAQRTLGGNAVNQSINRAIELLRVSNSNYSNPENVSVMKTPKGNWALYYDGKSVVTVTKDQLNESQLKASGKLLRSIPDVFQSKEYAFNYANKAVKPLRVMEVGGKYWVVTPADASRLEKGGYKYSKK